MTSSWYAAGAALLLLAAACNRSPGEVAAGLPSTPREPAATTLLRIPRAGGMARLYRIPSLDTIGWDMIDRVPAVQRVVGADPEQGLAFVLDRSNSLVALDLDTRRVRSQLRQVRSAAVGPDGIVYAVDTGSNVTRLVRRAPVRFRAKLQGEPRALHAALNGSLVAYIGGRQPALELLGSDRPPTSIPVPDGPITATRLGDLVAIAADTAVVLYSSDPKRQPLSISVSGGARAATFSPSGHLIYVAGEKDRITLIDRFGHGEVDRIELPGPARDLRADADGRWLLARPESDDSVWIVDIGTRKYQGAVAAKWSRELPIVAAPNTMLIRRGGDLVALDLGAPEFPETGRIRGGAEDFWLPLDWHPAGQIPEPVVEDTAPVIAEAGDSALDSLDALENISTEVFLQVSSSRNPTWADDMAAKLKAAGLPASVLPPKQTDEAYRVVLGPYATREQAEETARGLGMPSFVITAQGE